MPLAHRMAFIIEGNPLPSWELARLVALDIDHLPHDPLDIEVVEAITTRDRWLHDSQADLREARQAQWDSLAATPESNGLFELLGELRRTSDYQRTPADLAEQVWELIGFLADNPSLRDGLYAWANQPRTCSDSVARQFSDLLVHRQVVEVENRTGIEDAGEALLELGRKLFRLDQVQRFASRTLPSGWLPGGPSMPSRSICSTGCAWPRHWTCLSSRARCASRTWPTSAKHSCKRPCAPCRLRKPIKRWPRAWGRQFWRDYVQARHPAAFADLGASFEAQGSNWTTPAQGSPVRSTPSDGRVCKRRERRRCRRGSSC